DRSDPGTGRHEPFHFRRDLRAAHGGGGGPGELRGGHGAGLRAPGAFPGRAPGAADPLARPDRTVRDADVAKYREERLESARNVDELRRVQAEIEQTPVAPEFPAYRMLVVDRTGNLWVESYPRPGENGRRRWTVFDAA